MKGNKMSYVYKPIGLVELENKYNLYAVVYKNGIIDYLKDSKELEQLLRQCDERSDELSIYALQSVVRAEKVNSSDDYNDDDYNDDDDDYPYTDSYNTTTDIDRTIDEITAAFNKTLKEIVSKI